MVICKNCRTENPDVGKYCLECGEHLEEKNYPLANVLAIALMIIGFIVPFAYLFALIPSIYLYTRPVDSIKRRGALFIGISIVLFVIMFFVWAIINSYY